MRSTGEEDRSSGSGGALARLPATRSIQIVLILGVGFDYHACGALTRFHHGTRVCVHLICHLN